MTNRRGNPARGRALAARRARGLLTWAMLLHPGLALPHAATSNTVLFDREIVRILDAHCVMCHVQNGPSFALASYEETWLARDAIHDRILARQMPPWAAVPGYGRFANANRLTLREERSIVSWVEGLGPRNGGVVFLNVLDPAAAAREAIRARADFDVWALGPPDREIVVSSARAVAEIGAEGPARVLRAVVDTGVSTPTWLGALEFRPTDRSSTRAVVLSLEATGQWLATWTPWHGHRRLPDAAAYRLAPGARIVVEIHTAEPSDNIADAGRIGLHFAASASPAAVSELVLAAAADLPPTTPRQRLHAETELAADATLLALWPALPPGTESIEVSAILPNGRIEILLFALDIPLEWPTSYIYETPVELPRGSRLSFTAYVANDTPAPARAHVELTLSAVTE